MKKSLMHTLIVAMAATAPIAALAQADATAPATRAQVKHELVQLENAGYSPLGSSVDYPSALQAAEARSAAQAGDAVATTYGGQTAGSSAAGSRSSAPAKSLYLDNAGSLYVGD